MEIQLRAIERAVALVDDERNTHFLDGVSESAFCHFPFFVGSHGVLRSGGKLYMILETEHFIDIIAEFRDALNLIVNLFRQHEDMCVVLREGTDSHQTVQRAGKLMSVHLSELAAANRKISVGPHFTLVYQHRPRAVHRLDRVILAVDLGEIHVILIVIPMAGGPPKMLVENQRCLDLFIASLLMLRSPKSLQLIADDHALWQEKRESRTFLGQHEEIHLLADLTVVSLFRFLQFFDVGIQLFLGRECSRVNSLQHLSVGIASPPATLISLNALI